jgi:YD repeat-containing protein
LISKLNRLTSAKQPVSGVYRETTSEYDASGNLIKVTSPNQFNTRMVYDQANRLTKVVSLAGGRVRWGGTIHVLMPDTGLGLGRKPGGKAEISYETILVGRIVEGGRLQEATP